MLAFLSPYLRWIKLAGALSLLAGMAYGLWSLYHAGYQAGANEIQIRWDADKLRREDAQRAGLLAYAAKINQAQEQHDHDQATIDTLADTARRLRIHLPACGARAAASAGPNGAAGLFPAGVDQGFAEFQARIGGLIRRCDQLNIDAIRANAAGAGAAR